MPSLTVTCCLYDNYFPIGQCWKRCFLVTLHTLNTFADDIHDSCVHMFGLMLPLTRIRHTAHLRCGLDDLFMYPMHYDANIRSQKTVRLCE